MPFKSDYHQISEVMMKKGSDTEPSDHSSDSKRRRLLALTPPPDIFLFNSQENSSAEKHLDLKLNTLNEKSEDSMSLYSSTFGLSGCESSRSISSKKSTETSENPPEVKKQLCDLDFFNIMSEDEDVSSNSVINLFTNSRYFDVVQQSQDNNMNNLTKELGVYNRKYDHGRSNSNQNNVPLSSKMLNCDDAKAQIECNNSHYYSKSSSPSSIGTEMVIIILM